MHSLKDIYKKFQTPEGEGDKGTAHSYIDKYEELLAPFKQNCSILEIGIAGGHSLLMWSEYFEKSKIYGVDVSPRILQNPDLKSNKFNIILGDATKSKFLNQIGEQNFNIIIDDGSHLLEDQVKSFKLLKDRVLPGGLYIIEDVNHFSPEVEEIFKEMHNNCEIIDLRKIKNRYDDVLIVYRF